MAARRVASVQRAVSKLRAGMRRGSATAFAVVAATLFCVAAARGAGEQTRESYVATVDPICQRDRAAGERILSGTKDNVKDGKLAVAGGQLIRASERFGMTIREIVAVSRPPADDAKLRKWFGFLRIVKERIRMTGVFYKHGDRLAAT